MLRSIYLLICVCIALLSACGGGGGSSGANSLVNVPQSISSSLSIASSANSSITTNSSSISSAATSSDVSSSSSSLQSASSESSSSPVNVASLFPVAGGAVTEPIIQTTIVPPHLQLGETFSFGWVAFSTEGEIKNVNWVQMSGPSVTLKNSGNKLEVTADGVGEVVIEGSLTDSNGKTASKKIAFTVAQPFSPKAKLLQGNTNGQGLDLVIVGDAFLAEDQAKLEAAARNLLKYIFEYDNNALMRYQQLINVWLVESISPSRDVPLHTTGGNTLLGAFFGCAGIARLLCIDDQKAFDLVVQHVPQYDQILVLVNSDIYGGAGGQLATASLNGAVKNVVLHELGHSLVNLADEYIDSAVSNYITDEPFEVNATMSTDVPNLKWNYWFDDKNAIPGYSKFNYFETDVGYFQGGRYVTTGIWRPTFTSIMRELDKPYGNVNREAWALAIWSYYSSAGNFLPAVNEISISEKPQVFSVPLTINQNYTRISWSINDVPVEGSGSTPFLILTSVDESIQSVKVTVEDDTQFIRRDPKGVSKFQHTWSVKK